MPGDVKLLFACPGGRESYRLVAKTAVRQDVALLRAHAAARVCHRLVARIGDSPEEPVPARLPDAFPSVGLMAMPNDCRRSILPGPF